MVEILGNLITTYIVPLLKFSDIYIGSDGLLRPSGTGDPSLVFKYNEKDVIIVRTDEEFTRIRHQKDRYEIFNPLIVPRHMTFLSSLVVNKINSIVDPIPVDGKKTLVYDEDLDEYIFDNEEEREKELSTVIGMIHRKLDSGLIQLEFAYSDKNDNPVKTIASYTHLLPILAMYGLCVEGMKQFTTTIDHKLRNTDTAIDSICVGLNKYEREKNKGIRELTGFQGIDMTDEENDEIIMSYFDEIEFDLDPYDIDKDFLITPFTEKEDYSPDFSSSNGVINRKLVLPKFKDEESEVKELLYEYELHRFDDIDFTLSH
jgi:hypothetical protein